MRRLEVDEWDKERMRHFYYGLYGMGPWYWDMEERLHNPFFIGARGWNGPPESWIGENQVNLEWLGVGSVTEKVHPCGCKWGGGSDGAQKRGRDGGGKRWLPAESA
jgi:hypothetical protein